MADKRRKSTAPGSETPAPDAIELCLPLILPIGSRNPPQVFVMEPTDAGHLYL